MSAGSLTFYAHAQSTAEQAAIEQFRKRDQMLQDIGWRLAQSNAPFCDNAIPSIGLQLQDMASYGSPDKARAALGLNGDFAVQTVAKGSPAALSGGFAPNREITTVNTIAPNEWEAQEQLDWRRLTRLHDYIDEVLAENSQITFGFADHEPISVTAALACPTRFEISSSGDRAVAEGKRVVIGLQFAGFAYPEPLFASVVAHELAHNLLRHRAWLDQNKRTRKHVRATEREADRLMPWLLANAGYDPMAAIDFFKTHKPSSGSVLFIPGTHNKWEDRAALVQDEIPRVQMLMKAHGKADWSIHFKREIPVEQGQ